MERPDAESDKDKENGTTHIVSKVSYLSGVGTAHPLYEEFQRLRGFFLSTGFDEVENPMIVKKEEMFKQFENESYPVLSHTYFLSGYPKPIRKVSSKEVWNWLIRENIASDVDDDMNARIKEDLEHYLKNEIDAHALVDELCDSLSLDKEVVASMVTELMDLDHRKPKVSEDTLRSHMSSVWFPTIQAAIGHHADPPIKLFTMGRLFRKETTLDERHVMSYHIASCVIVDEEMTQDIAEAVARGILDRLGVVDPVIEPKEWTTNYFKRGQEYRVMLNDLEVAAFGIYSPDVLSKYGIHMPVFGFGIGIERILMAQKGYHNVNELLYPQFYSALSYTDSQIANSFGLIKSPKTKLGKTIAEAIVTAYEANSGAEAPIKVPVADIAIDEEMAAALSKIKKNGTIDHTKDLHVEVYLRESEGNRTLAGPLMFGRLMIVDGGIQLDTGQAAPQGEENPIPTGISVLDAFAKYAAWRIERNIGRGKAMTEVKMVKSLEDINLELEPGVRQYIITNDKTINVKGPLLARVVMKVRTGSKECGTQAEEPKPKAVKKEAEEQAPADTPAQNNGN